MVIKEFEFEIKDAKETERFLKRMLEYDPNLGSLFAFSNQSVGCFQHIRSALSVR